MRRVSGVVHYGPVTGKSGRLLGRALGHADGIVNWTGKPLEGAINEHVTTDKLDQISHLQFCEVPVPEFSREPVEGWAGRSRFHTRGHDFLRQETDFWTKMYPSESEWRMHVVRKPGSPRGNPASYEVFRTGQKVRGDSAARGVEWHGIPIRSRDFGWTLKYWRTGTRPNGLKQMATTAKWAVSCQHWDFGAVDLLKLGESGSIVLEVKS